jgi:heat shock protein HslJ/uncharacterized membrane protein/uncharacterized lipoprotein YbaY
VTSTPAQRRRSIACRYRPTTRLARYRAIVAVKLAAGLVAGCAQFPATAPPADPTSVLGELALRTRSALPPDSVAVVELRDGGGDGRLIAEWRQALAGRQAPIPFAFTVAPQARGAVARAAVRGAILVDGRPALRSDARPLTLGAGALEVGTLLLTAEPPLAYASELRCGARTLLSGIGKRDGRDVLQLVDGTRRIDLRDVVAASGARFEAIDVPGTTLWSKGLRATIVLDGATLPECDVRPLPAGTPTSPVAKPAAPGSAAPFAAFAPLTARGNEPAWTLTLDQRLRFTTDGRSVEGRTPAGQMRDGVRIHDGALIGQHVTVEVRESVCRDSMSGMPHPNTVQVRVDDRTFHGCGGRPLDLLLGAEWVVENIGGAGIVDRSRATLRFAEDGKVGGRSSCNIYTGSYTLTGEALTVGDTATTMMTCAPALMQQEQRFLDILQQLQRFEIEAAGALVLVDRSGRSITARRAG